MTKSEKPTQRVAVQRDNPQGAIRIIFAHGAGAGLQSDFMQFFALGLAFHDVDVVRFNFPYWQQFMDSGVRRPPNRMPELEHSMLTVAQQFDDAKPTFLMGKSMGARVAFRVADEVQARGAIALGFPFHPVGKPQQLRVDDLRNQRKQNLIIQGSRDAFGKPAEVATYALPKNLELHWLEHGDHSFEPTKRSGIERRDLWQAAIDRVSDFVQKHL
ncbi:alpha/beta family hydrolase [Pseudidiomarina salilacus]|uniref:alpha/beta family hydrolase n=1 Tax=Pseudidiomarina salilacus TaxID=3384452 RepID=UPI00398562DD